MYSKEEGKAWIVIVIIVTIIVVAFALGYIFVKSKYNKMNYQPIDTTDLGIDTTNEETTKIDNKIKFVIFGSDSRDESNEYAGRSDTIIIVVIDNENKSINLISIPRDSYVNVPGYGMTKINHAYAYGKEQLSIKTINTNFGLDLTQYMTIDFSGLVNSIDLVGGVTLNLTQEEVDFINSGMDADNKIQSAGEVTLNGKQALVHSRNRYVGNDFTREYRQRQILISLLNKISKMSVSEINNVADEVLPNITTNMDMAKYREMITDIAPNIKEYTSNITSVQIPSEEYGYDSWIDGIYYFGFDTDKAKQDFKTYYYGE